MIKETPDSAAGGISQKEAAMNEQQEVFAAQLQAANTVQQDHPMIDPHDPFANETEYHYYNQDYGDIVPQIRIPGCRIPLQPDIRERRGIRRYYNIAGTGLLLHLILSNVLAVFFIMLYYVLQTALDTSAAGGELPANYETLLEDFFTASSSNTAMNILIFMLCNVGIALIGCKWAKISIPSLFRTRDLRAGRILIYMSIAIGLQLICGKAATFISDFMSEVGITVFEPDFSTGQDIKNMVLMTIYTCIIAPVTEELLFRGFVMKNLSRVSQRFGIVASAVLFGLWHENIAQFVLAFFVGIFMGYLTVKHDSLVPAIICHMTVNTFSMLFDIAYTYEWYAVYTVLDCIYMAIAAIGVFMLVCTIIQERLPYTTPHQTERSFRIAATSIPLILVTIAHIVMTVVLIMDSSAG